MSSTRLDGQVYSSDPSFKHSTELHVYERMLKNKTKTSKNLPSATAMSEDLVSE